MSDYRDLHLETTNASDADPDRPPSVPFALTDGLAQVPGMTADLQRRLAEAITVYSGQARPRSQAMPPLVLAAIEGRTLDDAVPEPEDAPADDAPVLDETPTPLSEADEPMQTRSGLLHIEAEALSAGGAHFAREAVVGLQRRTGFSHHLRLWRRGVRVLFPISDDVTAMGSADR